MFNHLTNVIGPRLTGTPAFKQSIDWPAAKLKEYGLSNVRAESWPYGRGWKRQSRGKSGARLVRVKPEELKQAAVLLASFAYQATMRAERFSRAPAVR